MTHNELSEQDWETVNAYRDGELGDDAARRFEARLADEPALAEALHAVSDVSASLRRLQPETPTAVEPPEDAPRAFGGPMGWFAGGAIAASIALAVATAPGAPVPPTLISLHAELVEHPFDPVDADPVLIQASAEGTVPDLGSANLTPVAHQAVQDKAYVTHYAGRNGCRLSYFRGADLPTEATGMAQVVTWMTGGKLTHAIVATGMDQNKFDMIAAYLKQLTREEAAEEMMASVAEATATAERCMS